MNLKKLHNLFLIGIALCTCFSYAQNLDNQEVQDLKFQEYFFEDLKQNAKNNYSKAIENL